MTSTSPSTVLIYGGSFDPPHRGHVELPQHVAQQRDIDRILYIPAGTPPHKARRVTAAPHRLAMLRLALADRLNAQITTIELDRPGKSYTIDTLEALKNQLPPDTTMRLLIGADMAMIFDEWYESRRVAELAEPLVVIRPPHTRESLLQALEQGTSTPASIWDQRLVTAPTYDISSTSLREALAAGPYDSEIVKQYVADEVMDYIRQHALYRMPPPTDEK